MPGRVCSTVLSASRPALCRPLAFGDQPGDRSSVGEVAALHKAGEQAGSGDQDRPEPAGRRGHRERDVRAAELDRPGVGAVGGRRVAVDVQLGRLGTVALRCGCGAVRPGLQHDRGAPRAGAGVRLDRHRQSHPPLRDEGPIGEFVEVSRAGRDKSGGEPVVSVTVAWCTEPAGTVTIVITPAAPAGAQPAP